MELYQMSREDRYPYLQDAIGKQEVHCKSLEHYNRDGADCNPENWGQWMALLLSLECYPN